MKCLLLGAMALLIVGCSHWGDDWGLGATNTSHTIQVRNSSSRDVRVFDDFYNPLFENNCGTPDGPDNQIVRPGQVVTFAITVKCVSLQEVQWRAHIEDGFGRSFPYDVNSDTAIICDDSGCVSQNP